MSAPIDVRKLPGAEEVTLVRDAGYFPVLAVLGKCEVVAILRGGAGHLGLKGRLELVRSRDGGHTWLPPSVVADSDRDDRNPAVGVTPEGTLVVAYHHQGSYNEQGRYDRKIGIMDTLVIRSHDGGHSWEHPRKLDFEPLNGRSPYGPMVNFPDGTLGMCIYGMPMDDERPWDVPQYHTYLLRSPDGGLTWGAPSLVAQGFNETAFLRFPDSELIAGVRSPDRPPNVHVSRSADDGRTWSAPAPVTESGEHPADFALLSNGWVLLTYGHRREPFGVQGIVSRDRGRTWDRTRTLIYNDDRPGGDCGYPTTVRFPDGTMLTAYYSAGDHMDSYRLDGAFAAGVLYAEQELLSALE
ncbi:MAG: exo-alpha-sialidase [Armatimonadota bacterium]|nr:MAG: exo-alpha-sialidase [Armatimonadota bacterium]